MKVGFLAYGNVEMGMGHLYRCLRFARYWVSKRPESQITFETYPFPEVISLFESIKDFGVRYHQVGTLPDGEWDVLIVDQLETSGEAMRELKSRARVLVAIDDRGGGHFCADAAFNALYECRVARPKGSSTLSFSGFEYLMLDPAFSLAPKSDVFRRPKKLLITQGGSDTYQLVPKLVEAAVKRLPEDIEVHAFVGFGARHPESYFASLRESLRPERIHQRVDDMVRFLNEFDLAITSIGMTAFELAALGKPIVLLTGEAKELETGEKIAKATGATLCSLATSDQIAFACAKVEFLIRDDVERQLLAQRLARLIDGRGVHRIFSETVSLAERQQ